MCTKSVGTVSWTNLFSKYYQQFKNIACFLTRPILEEQALLREKLKTMPTWKKDKDPALKRKTQPMVRDCLQLASGHDAFTKPVYWPLLQNVFAVKPEKYVSY